MVGWSVVGVLSVGGLNMGISTAIGMNYNNIGCVVAGGLIIDHEPIVIAECVNDSEC